jgi:hypothetical protein
MQLKSTKKEYNDTWIQTASLIVALVFTLLASFGVITPEQSSGATPIVGTTLGAISTAIIGVIQLIGIFFKSTPK